MFCNNCGKKIKAGSDICPYCQADNTLPKVYSHFEIPEEVRQAKESKIRNIQESDGQQGTIPETETGHRNNSEMGPASNPEEERQRQDKIQREKREKKRKILMLAALVAVVLIAAAGTFRFFNRDVGAPSNEQIISDIEKVAEENEYPDEESITVTHQTKGIHPEATVEVTTDIPGADEGEKELTVTKNTYTLSYEKSGDGWNLKDDPKREADKTQENISVKEKNVVEEVMEWLEPQEDTEEYLESDGNYDGHINLDRKFVIKDSVDDIDFSYDSKKQMATYVLSYTKDRGFSHYEGVIQAAYTWNQRTDEWESETPYEKEKSVKYNYLNDTAYSLTVNGHDFLFYIKTISANKISFKFAVDGKEERQISRDGKKLVRKISEDCSTYYFDINLGSYGHIRVYPEKIRGIYYKYVKKDSFELKQMKYVKYKGNDIFEELLEAYDPSESSTGSASDLSTGSEPEEAATGASTGNIDTPKEPLRPNDNDSTYSDDDYNYPQNSDTNGYGYGGGFGSGTNRPPR